MPGAFADHRRPEEVYQRRGRLGGSLVLRQSDLHPVAGPLPVPRRSECGAGEATASGAIGHRISTGANPFCNKTGSKRGAPILGAPFICAAGQHQDMIECPPLSRRSPSILPIIVIAGFSGFAGLGYEM